MALVVGACVVDSGEEDGVEDFNEVSVVTGVVDSNEAEEVVGLVELNEVRGTVDLVESAVVATTVDKVVPFKAAVELSLALHCMPCRRVPMKNKQNRQLRKSERIYCLADSKFQIDSVQFL